MNFIKITNKKIGKKCKTKNDWGPPGNGPKLDNWSKVVNWSKLDDFFRRFPNFFQVVPGVFPGHFLLMERCSHEVLGVFWATFFSIFFGGVQEGPPIIFPDSWMVLGSFWKKWVWGPGHVTPPRPPPSPLWCQLDQIIKKRSLYSISHIDRAHVQELGSGSRFEDALFTFWGLCVMSLSWVFLRYDIRIPTSTRHFIRQDSPPFYPRHLSIKWKQLVETILSTQTGRPHPK